jgi:hypothetical protein
MGAKTIILLLFVFALIGAVVYLYYTIMIQRKKTKTKCDDKIKQMKICTDENGNLLSVSEIQCNKSNEQDLSNIHSKLCMDNDKKSTFFSKFDVNCNNISSENCQSYDQNMLDDLTNGIGIESEDVDAESEEEITEHNFIPETCLGKDINGYEIIDGKIMFACK